jgi:hypothetical protein
MRPGKRPTPYPHLDLERIWRELKEDPPGPIVNLDDKKLPPPSPPEQHGDR